MCLEEVFKHLWCCWCWTCWFCKGPWESSMGRHSQKPLVMLKRSVVMLMSETLKRRLERWSCWQCVDTVDTVGTIGSTPPPPPRKKKASLSLSLVPTESTPCWFSAHVSKHKNQHCRHNQRVKQVVALELPSTKFSPFSLPMVTCLESIPSSWSR